MLHQKSNKEITYTSHKHFSEVNFIEDLEKPPFYVTCLFEDVDDQMWFHKKFFEYAVTSHAPTKETIVKTDCCPT